MEYSVLCVILATLALVSTQHEQLIPQEFPQSPDQQYDIRYLAIGGSDSDDCLSSQPYPYNLSVVPCGTLRYALTGGYLLTTENKSNVILLVLPGEYVYGNISIILHNFRNIIVKKLPGSEGEVIFYCQQYLMDSFNNFYITSSDYIALQELTFTMCGPLSPGMATNEVNHLLIMNCVYRNNWNGGLAVIQADNFKVVNTDFHDNNNIRPYNNTGTLNPGDFSYAGGLSLVFQGNVTRSGVVKNCTFSQNIANISEQNVNDTRPILYIPNGHGGAVVLSFNGTEGHNLTIEDLQVVDNIAVHNGGGLHIRLFQRSSNNTVTIRNSQFKNNSCGGYGGAISMNVFEFGNDNLLIVENSTFENNSAIVGGGACSINLRDNLVSNTTRLIQNTATFSDCLFDSNSSPTGGSAVGLVSHARVDKAVAAANFTDCTFTGNRAENQSALLGFRFPLTLKGSTVFSDNEGGAVSLLQTRIDAMGDIGFKGNRAREGAAIAMEDQSLLHIFSGTNISFIDNHATTLGGAISVRNPSVGLDVILLFNTRCFIQYEVLTESGSLSPSNWTASLSFINNTAVINSAAIYATDISRCTYAPGNEAEDGSEYQKSMFTLSPPFTFSGNRVTGPGTQRAFEVPLGTAPSQLFVTPKMVTSAPGQVLEFNINATDQSGNPHRAVWSLDEDEPDEDESEDVQVENFFALTAEGSTHQYTMHPVDNNTYSNCSQGVTESLDFSLVQIIAGDVYSTSKVIVNVTCCYPGYHFSEEGQTCVYNNSNPVILRPDSKNQYIFLQPEIYAQVRNGELVTAMMPPPFQECSTVGSLAGCRFKHDKPEEQCAENRTGFLCGKCPVDQGVDLTLNGCKKCTVTDAIVFALIVLALVIAYILVLIFNIGVPNDLKGCLFFVQVVGFVYHNVRGNSISWDFHLSRLFGFSFYLPLCPYPGYDALSTALYGFLPSLLAVITIILYIFSARFIRLLSHRSSFDGIWLLSLFTYKYTADTCFNILRCTAVTGSTVEGELVFYYDGSIRCFDKEQHLGLAIFALFLGVLVVILFPVLIFVISFKHFKRTQPFTDVLNKGLKKSCRWWSGFDLFRRLIFIAIVFSFSYIRPGYTQVALLFAGLMVFFIFACAKPYKLRRTNAIEAFVLLDLLLVIALFLNLDERSGKSTKALALTLLLLPFLIVLFYIIVKVAKYFWKRTSPTSFRMFLMKIPLAARNHRLGSGSRSVDLRDLTIEVPDIDDYDEISSTEPEAEYIAYREDLLETN